MREFCRRRYSPPHPALGRVVMHDSGDWPITAIEPPRFATARSSIRTIRVRK